MIHIKRSGEFNTMLKELTVKKPTFSSLVKIKIKLFINKPDDTRLRNHKLIGRMKGKFAFSITSDIRIIYEWKSKKVARFLTIGTHPNVYKK